jgi:hypothetical protein
VSVAWGSIGHVDTEFFEKIKEKCKHNDRMIWIWSPLYLTWRWNQFQKKQRVSPPQERHLMESKTQTTRSPEGGSSCCCWLYLLFPFSASYFPLLGSHVRLWRKMGQGWGEERFESDIFSSPNTFFELMCSRFCKFVFFCDSVINIYYVILWLCNCIIDRNREELNDRFCYMCKYYKK